mmetsp:Transcript_11139/g.20316  ORF Transcript_11139/g.20316 Transcript_11139/m.20316 type:complete len:337 (-) Transcript_11139:345-1355(-)|eukprot:CAMPEP_0198283404 /NCGR_PEP_ID=MMETSP1449-20131203/3000_1 /TAXON_ID=420275 /ORGANISM="Attheya septentrionalis, Strain CCMP2084" /LENGTH=336 /DNA_ID=CAMNT_0043979989 /DNA_START=341 /DNA_END=1351 /DNA_ORIENTATION=+
MKSKHPGSSSVVASLRRSSAVIRSSVTNPFAISSNEPDRETRPLLKEGGSSTPSSVASSPQNDALSRGTNATGLSGTGGLGGMENFEISTAPRGKNKNYFFQVRGRDRRDASAKKKFQVQVPKKMIVYVLLVFFLLPLLLFGYVFMRQFLGYNSRYKQHGPSHHLHGSNRVPTKREWTNATHFVDVPDFHDVSSDEPTKEDSSDENGNHKEIQNGDPADSLDHSLDGQKLKETTDDAFDTGKENEDDENELASGDTKGNAKLTVKHATVSTTTSGGTTAVIDTTATGAAKTAKDNAYDTNKNKHNMITRNATNTKKKKSTSIKKKKKKEVAVIPEA